MSVSPLNWAQRSTIGFDGGQRDNMIQQLQQGGFAGSRAALNALTNDEILAAANQLNSDNYQNKQRQRDRQDALVDFRAQLGDLTASKQRQAEQAGRLAQANTRTQGLSSMMANF